MPLKKSTNRTKSGCKNQLYSTRVTTVHTTKVLFPCTPWTHKRLCTSLLKSQLLYRLRKCQRSLLNSHLTTQDNPSPLYKSKSNFCKKRTSTWKRSWEAKVSYLLWNLPSKVVSQRLNEDQQLPNKLRSTISRNRSLWLTPLKNSQLDEARPATQFWSFQIPNQSVLHL